MIYNSFNSDYTSRKLVQERLYWRSYPESDYSEYDSEVVVEEKLLLKIKHSLRIKRNAKIYEKRKKKFKNSIERLKSKDSRNYKRKVGILKTHGSLYRKDIDEEDYWFVKLKREKLKAFQELQKIKKEYIGNVIESEEGVNYD